MEDLGTLGGDEANAEAISADGTVVVGWSRNPSNGSFRAFRWIAGATNGVSSNPQMKGLGKFGPLERYGVPALAGKASAAFDVNADGTVMVGESWTWGQGEGASESLGDRVYHAFRWVLGGTDGVEGNPQMQDLGVLGVDVGCDDWECWYIAGSTAYGVNADGTVGSA
jgi:probable HAF family extracellular repeat protein